MKVQSRQAATLEQQLEAKNQEDCMAAAKAIDAALTKHGCQLKFRRITQVGTDGVVRAIEERYVVKSPPPKKA